MIRRAIVELVYLWVEDYKNIHRQGFNFSPRFRCKFDGETLTIDENVDEKGNKQYIENFFGDNINVTAIVGKNGSGKSSVLEVLAFLYWNGAIPATGKNDKTFFIYKSGGRFHVQCENYKIYQDSGFQGLFYNIRNSTAIAKPTRFTHRTSMPLIAFSNCISDMTYNKNLEKLKTYDKFYNGIQPNDPMMKSDDTYDNFNQKFYYLLNRNKNIFCHIDKKLIFDRYRFEIHVTELEAWIAQIENEEFSKLLSFQRTYEAQKEPILWHIFFVHLFFNAKKIIYHSNHTDLQPDTANAEILNEFIETKLIEPIMKTSLLGLGAFEEAFNELIKIIENALKSIGEEIDPGVYDISAFNNFTIQSERDDFKEVVKVESIKLMSKVESIDDINLFEVLNNNSLMKSLHRDNILRINFIKEDSEYNFLSLSSGEKLFLNILTNYAYTLYKLESDYKGIMLFDEIELSFHPDWQKRLLDNLFYLYRKVSSDRSDNLNIHMLFSSHSPFLLSDIPKQNIIFLDTDEEGKCKVLKHDEVMEKKETFGANIHTLLSNSFFMEDGLMGEFAKDKINKIIKYLREDIIPEPREKWVDAKENLKKIIESIGEPFLRNKVLELYYDKFTDDATKKSRKEELEKQKKQIERELSRYD